LTKFGWAFFFSLKGFYIGSTFVHTILLNNFCTDEDILYLLPETLFYCVYLFIDLSLFYLHYICLYGDVMAQPHFVTLRLPVRVRKVPVWVRIGEDRQT